MVIFITVAWCWGDPHVTNLDGGVRTFNGWGEYPLLLILTNDTNFYLQGRLQPLENSTATQLVAFAFGDPQQATVEVSPIVMSPSLEWYSHLIACTNTFHACITSNYGT